MAKQNSKQDSAAAAAAASQGLGGQPSGGLASYGSSFTAAGDGKVHLLTELFFKNVPYRKQFNAMPTISSVLDCCGSGAS